MPRPKKLLFLVADATRARLIERSDVGDFTTFKEIDGGARLKDLREIVRKDPPGRSIESVGGARHAVGPEDPYQSLKLEFAATAAAEAQRQAGARGASGIVIVSPARLLSTMKRRCEGNVRVLATLAKDLTKTPDEELERWLSPLEAQARREEIAEARA